MPRMLRRRTQDGDDDTLLSAVTNAGHRHTRQPPPPPQGLTMTRQRRQHGCRLLLSWPAPKEAAPGRPGTSRSGAATGRRTPGGTRGGTRAGAGARRRPRSLQGTPRTAPRRTQLQLPSSRRRRRRSRTPPRPCLAKCTPASGTWPARPRRARPRRGRDRGRAPRRARAAGTATAPAAPGAQEGGGRDHEQRGHGGRDQHAVPGHGRRRHRRCAGTDPYVHGSRSLPACL